ncbi:MAG: tetratricopeptide repeat protein [Phycisphaerae bacterium]
MPRWPIAAFVEAVVLVFATCLVYSNCFDGRYQIDDQHVIVENLTIRDLWASFREIGTSTRSLVNFTFALNFACHGLDRWGYHLVNVIVHGLATLALFAWLRSLMLSPNAWPAFWIALVFGVHPLTTQSVTYICQRYSSMAGLFFFLCLWCWSRFRRGGRAGWYALCLASAVAAMLCKEMAVMIPVALVVADFVLHRAEDGFGIKRRWAAYAPLVLLLFLVPTLNLLRRNYSLAEIDEALDWSQGADITRWQYLLTQIRLIVVTYLRLMVLPVGQSVDHPVIIIRSPADPETAATAMLLLVLLAVSVYAAFLRPERLPRLAGFGGLLFFLGLAATSTIVPNAAIVQEQRLYVSLAGYLVAVAALLWALPVHRFLPTATLAAAALVLAILTHERNKVWHSDSVVWQDALNHAPNSPRAHNNLALALADLGQSEKAIAHYREAIRLNPRYPYAYSNLGNLLFRQGRVADALLLYAEAVRLKPDFADCHNNLAAALETTGQYAASIKHCRLALEIKPDFADAHNNLGNALSGQLDLEQSAAEYRIAIALYARLNNAKDGAMAHNNLASVLVRLGRRDEAKGEYERALQLDPGYTDARTNLERLGHP